MKTKDKYHNTPEDLQKNIESIFTSEKYKDYSKKDLIDALRIYINNKPLYINEIRNFLKENDTDLFRLYGLCFKHNAGVTCAFGIEQDTSKVELQTSHIKYFKTYKPVYKNEKEFKKEAALKKKVKKNSKKEQIKKFKSKEEDKKENERKIRDIKSRIQKQ